MAMAYPSENEKEELGRSHPEVTGELQTGERLGYTEGNWRCHGG